MPHLKQFIGGLLEELAQARADADHFSAQLSQQYAEDELLQHFPVPRMDMGTVRFRMKVAMLDEKLKSEVLNSFWDQESKNLKDSWQRIFKEQIDQDADLKPEAAAELLALVSSEGYQQQVETALRFVFRNMSASQFDSSFNLNISQAFEALRPSLSIWYLSQPLLNDLYEADQSAIAGLTLAMETATQGFLLSLQDAILKLAADDLNREAPVEVNADRLREMPESSLTEIQFETSVQNYQWTEEGESTGEAPTLHLLPL
jgi:hypothetical protein